MHKKVFPLFLAILMAALTLSACGGGGGEDPTPTHAPNKLEQAGWVSEGTYVSLTDSQGNPAGFLQLYPDEVQGIVVHANGQSAGNPFPSDTSVGVWNGLSYYFFEGEFYSKKINTP